MRRSPQERDRLLGHVAADVARRRLERGVADPAAGRRHAGDRPRLRRGDRGLARAVAAYPALPGDD
jgi:hypothetical protein